MILERLRNRLRRHAPQTVSRFSLSSGERQTGLRLADIRTDHLLRYEYACATIHRYLERRAEAFGLDVFCGTGYGTHMLADAIRNPILGIDASTEAISVANAHYANEQTFFAAKLFPFSLPRNTFDFVVCMESLEHVAETERFLDQIVGALKPGGILILSTPNASVWSLERNPNPFHYRHFSRDELLAVLTTHPNYRLNSIDWQGQDIYHFEQGIIARPLPPEQMSLRPQAEGQILIFSFEKTT